MTSEHGTGDTTAKTSEPGAPTTPGGNMDKYTGWVEDDSLETSDNTAETFEPGAPTREVGEIKNQGAIGNDTIERQLLNTKAQVIGTFQKLLDPNSYTLENFTATVNPSRERGGKVKNHGPNDDDDFVTQIKNTEAQVLETFAGLSTSLQQAGEKIKGAFTGVTGEGSSK